MAATKRTEDERRRQEEERIRAEEEAFAEEEWDADLPQQAPPPSFADLLAHGMGVFQDEMAKKNAEQAAANARIAHVREQAAAIERERERQASPSASSSL